jgi:hypothetical protein
LGCPQLVHGDFWDTKLPFRQGRLEELTRS